MGITGTIPVSDIIAPTSELDVYPVTDPKYGLGGLRNVANITERNAIPTQRRQVGMMVYVTSEKKYYILEGGISDIYWKAFDQGGVTGISAGHTGIAVSGTTGFIRIFNMGVLSLDGQTGHVSIGATGNTVVAGSGIDVLSLGGNERRITNIGVTGISAGAGMSVSGTTGDVRIFNTGVHSINSLTGPLQISAGSNVQVIVEGNNKLVITSLDATFDSDITASFEVGNTFGKYEYGQRIPATGKTALEVIKDALLGSVPPTVAISSPTTVQFNNTSINNRINVSYTIQTIGATAASATLRYRRQNEPSFTTIATNLFSPVGTSFSGGMTHSFQDSNYNLNDFLYEYTVTDSAGESVTRSMTVTGGRYANPSCTISQSSLNSLIPNVETVTRRERGKLDTRLSGSATTPNSFVPLTTYVIQRSVNGAAYTNLQSGNIVNGNIPQYDDSSLNPYTTNNVTYRLVVLDGFRTNVSNPAAATSAAQIIFSDFIWYGPIASPPTDPSQPRALTPMNPDYNSQNPFTFSTGTVFRNMVVALPVPLRIQSNGGAYDITNNIDLTSNFVTGNSAIGWDGLFFVNDAAGLPRSYNVYNSNTTNAYTEGAATIRIARE